ncbi:4-hydroxy-tetrahydrodipicolinate synthase [Pseudonocardia sp. TRM90224]|uniref:4-hydroxy-tetrahydrodipicolinate synthase n=1 Tax=Pseudonocardia sp. TRM90224 TaxID=2812678 RepID=UPI001E510A05|nr:4-hydroxy-tetrahydrodipicolinate synthase [Pseudonocardia sp. TRM90224]
MSPRGLFVPLVTPFGPTGAVDVAALEKLAGDVLDNGADGLVALGTTGEPATLDAVERRAVITACARVAAGRPLLVGVGGNNTRAGVDALRDLAGVPGVTAALVPVPPYTRPSAAGVAAHFTQLAAASSLPLLVYNVPHRTGLAVDGATLRELATIPGVVGMKQATAALDADTVVLLADPPPDFVVLAGDDVMAGPLLALGAAGGILASAHVATDRWAAMVGAWRRGDALAARAAAAPLAALAAALFAEPNPSVIKGVLHAQGRIPTADVRLPLLPATPAAVEAALARIP